MVAIRRLSVILGVVAIVLAAGAARADTLRGKFTLPVETRWGTATLPPGEYTFNLDTAQFPNFATIRGENTAAFVMPSHGIDRAVSGRSYLILIRSGNRAVVRQLHLAEAGLAFNYGPMPKGKLIAKNPELIQRVPVVLMASAQ
jgi:hypothetical protein